MTRFRVSMVLIAVFAAIVLGVVITWLSHDVPAVVPLIDDLTPDDSPASSAAVTPFRTAIEAKAAVGPAGERLPRDSLLPRIRLAPLEAVVQAGAGIASLSLRTTSISGTPVAGVCVGLFQAEPGDASDEDALLRAPKARVRTGADGRAVVHGLGERPAHVVCQNTEGFFPPEPVIVVPRGQEVALVLRPAALISGVVVGPAGAPVDRVSIGRIDGGSYARRSTSAGRFCVSVPLGETVDLGVIGEKHVEQRADGFIERISFDSRPWVIVDTATIYRGQLHGVSAPASNLVLRLEAVPSDRAIQVVVRDADGLPAAQVVVNIGGTFDIPSGTTDVEGRVAFTGLRDEEVVIQAIPGDGGDSHWVESTPVKATPNGQSIELRLRRAATIAGIVLDPDGTPVWGDIVRVSSPQENGAAVVTDASGRFRLMVAPDARYELSVEHIADRQFNTTLSDVASDGAEVVVRLGQR